MNNKGVVMNSNYNDEIDIVKDIVYNTMINIIKLSVPLDVDVETGNNWYEAK